jgi:hypothetical protein
MSAVLEVPISDLTYTLVRPMITEVVRQMLDATGVDPHTEIRYYGADAGAPQLGSQIDKSEEPKVMSTNRFPHKGHVKIEVEEQPNVNMMGMSGRGGATMPDFFTDSNLGVSVRATRGAYKADIRISFRSPDNNAASMWADLFRSKVEQIRGSLAHAVDFNYVIPESVIERLNAVHECREKVAGYGEEFVDYLVKHSDGRIKFLTTQAGTEPVATVVEREGNIIGVFDVQAVPERASRMDEPNLWEVNFTYTIWYDRPLTMIIRHPLFVHQQLLPQKYFTYRIGTGAQPANYRRSYADQAWRDLEDRNIGYATQGNHGLIIPSMDDPAPGHVPYGTVRAASILCSIEPGNTRDLVNLNDLGGDWAIKQEVLDLLKAGEWRYAQHDQGLIRLTLYRGNSIDTTGLEVDENLNVRIAGGGDLRVPHRVRLSLQANHGIFDSSTFKRLYARPGIDMLLNSINAAIKDRTTERDIPYRRIPERYVKQFGCSYEAPREAGRISIDGSTGSSAGGVYLVQDFFVRIVRAKST